MAPPFVGLGPVGLGLGPVGLGLVGLGLVLGVDPSGVGAAGAADSWSPEPVAQPPTAKATTLTTNARRSITSLQGSGAGRPN